VVRLAARLNGHLVNVMAPAAKSERAQMVERLKAMQGWAREAGILLTVETHTYQFTERPADALWLCEQVPGLGLTLDPSHYYAGPNQGAPFAELYPYVRGTGFRAGGMSWKEVQMPWGTGPIDFASVVRRLVATGYRGFYVAEYIEGFNDLDALKESRRFLEWARQLQ
jgi:sugar phosphate isomerase/epimerase